MIAQINVEVIIKLFPPVRFTGRGWGRRTLPLQLLQVSHQEVSPVVIENLEHVVPTVLAQHLLDLLHVIALLVLYHLKTLVRDQFCLYQQLLVLSPGRLNSIANLVYNNSV